MGATSELGVAEDNPLPLIPQGSTWVTPALRTSSAPWDPWIEGPYPGFDGGLLGLMASL